MMAVMDKDAVPYLMLVLAVVLIYVPRAFVGRAQAARPEGYDNAHPRQQQKELTGLGARAQGAHENSFEAFGPFAAGVLACKTAGVDSDEIVLVSGAFIVLRTLYLVLYLTNQPKARSAVWGLGLLSSLTLLCLPFFR